MSEKEVRKQVQQNRQNITEVKNRLFRLEDSFVTKKELTLLETRLLQEQKKYVQKALFESELLLFREQQKRELRMVNVLVEKINRQYEQIAGLKKEIEEVLKELFETLADAREKQKEQETWKREVAKKTDMNMAFIRIRAETAKEQQMKSELRRIDQELHMLYLRTAKKEDVKTSLQRVEGMLNQHREELLKITNQLRKRRIF